MLRTCLFILRTDIFCGYLCSKLVGFLDNSIDIFELCLFFTFLNAFRERGLSFFIDLIKIIHVMPLIKDYKHHHYQIYSSYFLLGLGWWFPEQIYSALSIIIDSILDAHSK